ncbi:hypothetical protein [Ramlibacter albus]|uniref:Uncharacterized protein n=1 Tax=Ramlibacter albus TaxID=2079448 RepID=A0A923S5W9_9BURK|nr:hypothetical protein [Ramlibacter albus]MBC5765577.1 hypothetical protein [Ramlibacter albus]
MTEPTRLYAITPKGRQVLRGPTVWCLTAHLRDVLVLCDPAISMAHLRQTMPRESLNAALFALWDLGLVDGPPVEAPDHSQWEFDARSRPIGPLPRARKARPVEGAPARAA